MKLISICISNVPEYLRCGSYFESLNENAEQDEYLTIPSDCIKINDEIDDANDLYQYLNSLRFWLVSEIPDRLLAAVLSNASLLSCVMDEFATDFPYLSELVAIGGIDDDKGRLAKAASTGCLPALKYLLDRAKRSDLSKELAECAARYGHLDCLQLLHKTGCPWDEHTCTVAAMGGSLDCLQYAHLNGCALTVDVSVSAARYDHLDCLIYAHRQGVEWSKVVCAAAALSGSLRCLEYAHVQGCPWATHVCQIAAARGHLSCLQFALSYGCPWDGNTCKHAAENGQFQCLQLAHAHGCTIEKELCLVDTSLSEEHKLCAQFVEQHGV